MPDSRGMGFSVGIVEAMVSASLLFDLAWVDDLMLLATHL